jgi:hypothetical protein
VPGGFFAELFDLRAGYGPPVEDLPKPYEWGDEETARSRLEGLASHVDFERHAIEWVAESAEAFEEEQMATVPTYAAAKAALPADRFEEMRRETAAVAARWNSAEDGGLRLEWEYLVTVARKRG